MLAVLTGFFSSSISFFWRGVSRWLTVSKRVSRCVRQVLEISISHICAPRGIQQFSPLTGSRVLHFVHLRTSWYSAFSSTYRISRALFRTFTHLVVLSISFHLQDLESSISYIYAPRGTEHFFSTYRVLFSIAPRCISGFREDIPQQRTRIVNTPSFFRSIAPTSNYI